MAERASVETAMKAKITRCALTSASDMSLTPALREKISVSKPYAIAGSSTRLGRIVFPQHNARGEPHPTAGVEATDFSAERFSTIF